MARTTIELDVINRAYELVVWASQHLEKFPKTYRFTLAERVGNRLYEVLEMLIEAKYSSAPKELLQRVNLHLEVLRFQFRLAKDLRCWSIDHYGSGCRKVDDVGRLVGGWLTSGRRTEGKADETLRKPVAGTDQPPPSAALGRKGSSRKKPPGERGDIPF